jgi:voltage-gated potassium channel
MTMKQKSACGDGEVHESGHVVLIRYNGLSETLDIVQEIRRDTKFANTLIVLVDEHLEVLPDRLAGENVTYIRGKPARGDALKRANVTEARYVLILANKKRPEESDNENLAVALTIDSLCDDEHVHMVVECMEADNQVLFDRVHVDGIICSDAMSTQLLVQELQDPGVTEVIKQLTTNSQGKQFYVIDAPDGVGTYGELVTYYLARDGQVLGLVRDDATHLIPKYETGLKSGDRVILIAENRPPSGAV